MNNSSVDEVLENSSISSISCDSNVLIVGQLSVVTSFDCLSFFVLAKPDVLSLPLEDVLRRSSVVLDLWLSSSLFIFGIILDLLPPRDVVVVLNFTPESVVIVEELLIAHEFIHPLEGLVFIVDCDRAHQVVTNLLVDEVSNSVENSNYTTSNSKRADNRVEHNHVLHDL
jgi:hypothetical protein